MRYGELWEETTVMCMYTGLETGSCMPHSNINHHCPRFPREIHLFSPKFAFYTSDFVEYFQLFNELAR